MKNLVLVGLSLCIVFLGSCLDTPELPEVRLRWEREDILIDMDQFELDQNIISTYLEDSSITASIDTVFDLYYVIHSPGNSLTPNLLNNVEVSYAGRILGDSSDFDSGNNVVFPLSGLIGGWQLLLPYLGEGGSMTMYIPSGLGYGTQGSGTTIPPNSNLVFDIDLHSVY